MQWIHHARKLLDTSVENLRCCGVSNSMARYLRGLAEFALVNNLEELSGASDDAIRATRFAVPGIGKWTYDLFLLFYLEREDILPVKDRTYRKAFNWLYGASVENEGSGWLFAICGNRTRQRPSVTCITP